MKRSVRWLRSSASHDQDGMIQVDREANRALRALSERARQEIAKVVRFIIFPEGRRRAPGANARLSTRG